MMKHIKPWETIKREYILESRWLNVRRDMCEKADRTIIAPFYVTEYPEWVSVFVQTADGEILMVENYRHGADVVITELVGGTCETDEQAASCAKREVAEELGYTGGELVPLGVVWANADKSPNKVHMFLAHGGQVTDKQKLDYSEDFRVVRTTLQKLKKQLDEPTLVMQSYTRLCIRESLAYLENN